MEGIPVWEAECQFDSKLFLDEYPRWREMAPRPPTSLHPSEDVCIHPKRQDAKNVNGLSIKAASNWSLGGKLM